MTVEKSLQERIGRLESALRDRDREIDELTARIASLKVCDGCHGTGRHPQNDTICKWCGGRTLTDNTSP
jgi:hypothetical protein